MPALALIYQKQDEVRKAFLSLTVKFYDKYVSCSVRPASIIDQVSDDYLKDDAMSKDSQGGKERKSDTYKLLYIYIYIFMQYEKGGSYTHSMVVKCLV